MSPIDDQQALSNDLWDECIQQIVIHAKLHDAGTIRLDSDCFTLVVPPGHAPECYPPGTRYVDTYQVMQHPNLNILVYIHLNENNRGITEDSRRIWERNWRVGLVGIVPFETPGIFGKSRDARDQPDLWIPGGLCTWDRIRHCPPGAPWSEPAESSGDLRSISSFIDVRGDKRVERDADLLPQAVGRFVALALRSGELQRYAVPGRLKHLKGLIPESRLLAYVCERTPDAPAHFWENFPLTALHMADGSTCEADFKEDLSLERKMTKFLK